MWLICSFLLCCAVISNTDDVSAITDVVTAIADATSSITDAITEHYQ